jgi:hypothetical protein
MTNPPARDPIAHVARGFLGLLGRSAADQEHLAAQLTDGMTAEEARLIADPCEKYARHARRRLAELQRGKTGNAPEPSPDIRSRRFMGP